MAIKAFPCEEYIYHDIDIKPGSLQRPTTEIRHPGMDLRDYFAAKALQGQLARTPWKELIGLQDVAKLCYQWSDAMMEARNGNNE